MRALAAEGRAPRVIVIENVTGILTSRGGADFAAVGEALAGAGYTFGALVADAARLRSPEPAASVLPRHAGAGRAARKVPIRAGIRRA